MRKFFSRIKKYLLGIITLLWWHAPLRRERRIKIKSFFFRTFPILFKNTSIYKSWKDSLLLSQDITYDSDINYPSHWPTLIGKNDAELKAQRYAKQEAKPIDLLAIIIHAFYGDILQEILDYLGDNKKESCKLFVTYPAEKEQEIQSVLNASKFEYESKVSENRGRDILPFLASSQLAINQGYELLLKIHTKKSDHRQTAKLWREEIYSALLPVEKRERIIDIFNSNCDIGILGPAGHIVPMNLYYGKNAKAIGYLSRQMGVDTKVIKDLIFVAGTMFYIRRSALMPLLDLNMPTEVFEPEAGQTDGTMAHAYERAFSISAYASGLRIVDTNFDSKNPKAKVITDHPFTW